MDLSQKEEVEVSYHSNEKNLDNSLDNKMIKIIMIIILAIIKISGSAEDQNFSIDLEKERFLLKELKNFLKKLLVRKNLKKMGPLLMRIVIILISFQVILFIIKIKNKLHNLKIISSFAIILTVILVINQLLFTILKKMKISLIIIWLMMVSSNK